jgi:hypothetical protein
MKKRNNMKAVLIVFVLFAAMELIICATLAQSSIQMDGNHSVPIRLSVRVLAGPDADALTYTGRWVYVKGGQEFSVKISDKTNRFKAYFGDYIKSCEIRRTSMNETSGFATWFYFDVNEGGTNVFESPELTNEDLFVYEKK